MTLPEERPWSMDLLDAHPRRHRTLDVERHRIMEEIDRARHALGRPHDRISISRLVGVDRLTSLSASGRTMHLAVSMPSIVVAHMPDADHDEEVRIAMAHRMLDVAERAILVEEIDERETLDRNQSAQDLACMLGRIVRQIIGDQWVNPAFVKVRPLSPFGPASASIRTARLGETLEVSIPEDIATRHGLGSGWAVWEETKADTSVVLTSPVGIGAIPLNDDPVELLREMARPGMAELAASLVDAHPIPNV